MRPIFEIFRIRFIAASSFFSPLNVRIERKFDALSFLTENRRPPLLLKFKANPFRVLFFEI